MPLCKIVKKTVSLFILKNMQKKYVKEQKFSLAWPYTSISTYLKHVK